MKLIDEIKDSLKSYHANVNWFVFLFISLFTIGSWIDINGMWCELPIMVHELPEGWRLPSILGIITQVSQIAPIVFIGLKWAYPKRVSFVLTIYIILSIGALSCLLLTFFWNKTLKIGSEDRSFGLYILTFTLSVLDGTSSVTFLQYIAENYKKEYIIPNYFGESLSAMLPSLLGIIQGVGQDLGCINVTINNKTELEPIPLVPNFSVSVYYIILFILLCISLTAFSLLKFLPLSRQARKQNLISSINPEYNYDINNSENKISSTVSIIEKESIQDPIKEVKKPSSKPTLKEQKILLTIIFMVSLVAYGVLSGMQSYSCIPYGNKKATRVNVRNFYLYLLGNDIFHLSINLSFFFMPIVILLSIWSYNISITRIITEFFIGIAISIYIIIIAIMSPCPPMNNWLGSTIMVLAWVLTQNIFIRVRCCVAARLEECGQKVLLLLGGCTVAGQIIGGLISFLLIDTYRLFEDLPPCVSALDYCATKGK